MSIRARGLRTLAAAGLAAGVAASAQAQVAAGGAAKVNAAALRPSVCTPLPCDGLSVLGAGQSWVPLSPDWTPDRRPVAYIRTLGGSFCYNSRGLTKEWYDGDDEGTAPKDLNKNGVPDAFDWLLAQLDGAYADGWRRLVLLLPAGVAISQEFSSSQWWAMPAWRRAGFETYVKPWIAAHPGASVGLYLNYLINDPCSLCQEPNAYRRVTPVDPATLGYPDTCGTGTVYVQPCFLKNRGRAPDPRSREDVCIFSQNIRPWMSLGAREFWFDAAAYLARKDSLVEMAWNPDYVGKARFGGEAIPYKSHGEFDGSYIPLAPWFCTTDWTDGQDPDASWTFPVETSEVGLGLMRPMDLMEMYDAVARGYVIWIYDVGSKDAGRAKRIYGFGRIPDGADFNGNGYPDAQDVTLFNAQWSLYRGKTGRGFNYIHGDMNDDHKVDDTDKTLFNLYWSKSLSSQPVPLDLGEPNPEDALP